MNELFCLNTTQDITAMRTAFEQRGDKSLTDRLRSELSGEHEKLILKLLLSGRGAQPADAARARAQAEELSQIIKKGTGMMGGLKEAAAIQVLFA